tara:strand:+ start:279 stop:665 length:387 start_codon:yes stop_codon:yes gene_type:complete
MYKIRFNLGRGDNYRKWKVIDKTDNSFQILDPEKGSIIMNECRLINKKGGAKKIFNGKNKFVVAWVLCKSFDFIEDSIFGLDYDPCVDAEVSFNPRVKPNWECFGQDFDGTFHDTLYTVGNKVHIKTN